MADCAGTDSVLVLTGETSREDLAESAVKPTIVLDSVADIPSGIEFRKKFRYRYKFRR